MLFGSYARGEADEGSDVDLLLLLDGEVDTVREMMRAQEVKWPLALEAGYAVSLLPVSQKECLKTLLEKARRSFAAADLLLGEGDAAFAASRAYYYVAEALLLSEGLRFSRHGRDRPVRTVLR